MKRSPAIHLWFVTRALAAWIAAEDSGGDAMLFHTFARLMRDGHVPYRDFAAEYPPLAMPIFRAPLAFAADYGTYRLLWALAMLAIDGALSWMLVRRDARAGLLYVAASAPLLGVGLNRFDLLPALATAAALLAWEAGRAARAGVWLGAGVALKLYPLAVGPALLLDAARRRVRIARPLAAFAAVALVALVAPVLALGSFLGWHARRGLHAECVLATPWLVFAARPLALDHTYGSYDLPGPLAATVAATTPILQLFAAAGAFFWLARRRRPVAEVAHATLLAALVFAKTLSPQFLLWSAPLYALAAPRGWRAWPFLAAAALTLPIYPFAYADFLRGHAGAYALVAARNVALCAALAAALATPSRPPAPAHPPVAAPPDAGRDGSSG